jgi:hypothetical protein
MQGMGGLNHKNQQRPTSYTNTNNIHYQVPENRYQSVAASLWPVATVAGAELHYICIKKPAMSMMEWGGLNHKNQQRLLHLDQGDPSQVP